MNNNRRSRWSLVVDDPSVPGLINAMTQENIAFFGLHCPSAITAEFQVLHRDIAAVKAILEKRGSTVRQCKPYGPHILFARLFHRRWLWVNALLWTVVLLVSSLFVWRIEVDGNVEVTDGEILRTMEQLHAGIGSFWPRFDGEALQTQMLLDMPELQWVGINYGAGLVRVTVREREIAPELTDNREPMNIIAKTDGVVSHISALQGQTKVAEGEAVEKGQLLISGFAESPTGAARKVHALGTVEARTYRTLSVKQPAAVTQKAYTGRKSYKISLNFMGKRVNLYFGSSFSGATCDKITMDYHLCMDGVFALPVGLTVEEYVYYEQQPRQISPEQQENAAKQALMDNLNASLEDGEQVLHTDFAATHRPEGVMVTVRAEVLEEIGEEVPLTQEHEEEQIVGDELAND